LERIPPWPVAAEQRPLGLGLTFIVEVAGRAEALELRQVELHFLEVPHIGILRFLGGFYCSNAALQRFRDDVRDVIALLSELLRSRGVQATLDVADVELIRKAVRHRAMQGLRSIRPMIVNGLAIAAGDDIDSPTAVEIAGYFETTGENHTVNFV